MQRQRAIFLSNLGILSVASGAFISYIFEQNSINSKGSVIINTGTSEAPAKALHPLRRFVRFGLVGGMGVLVNLGSYVILHAVLALSYQWARAWAIEVSIIGNFILNERWTFRDRAHGGWGTYIKRMLLFHIPSWLVAGFVQIWTHETLRRLFGVNAESEPHWKDFLAYLIAIALGALLNFFISNFLVFRNKSANQ